MGTPFINPFKTLDTFTPTTHFFQILFPCALLYEVTSFARFSAKCSLFFFFFFIMFTATLHASLYKLLFCSIKLSSLPEFFHLSVNYHFSSTLHVLYQLLSSALFCMYFLPVTGVTFYVLYSRKECILYISLSVPHFLHSDAFQHTFTTSVLQVTS